MRRPKTKVSEAAPAAMPVDHRGDAQSDQALVLDGINAWYRGDVAGAIRSLERVRERGTANPRVLYTLGLLYCHVGNDDTGTHAIEAATAA